MNIFTKINTNKIIKILFSTKLYLQQKKTKECHATQSVVIITISIIIIIDQLIMWEGDRRHEITTVDTVHLMISVTAIRVGEAKLETEDE